MGKDMNELYYKLKSNSYVLTKNQINNIIEGETNKLKKIIKTVNNIFQ
jgi:hypothetical protein